MNKHLSRPKTDYILLIAVLFQGLSGILGGIGLIIDPSGSMLNIPIEWLQDSPFNSYLLPGIILFTVLGVFPIIVFLWLLKKNSKGWVGSIMLGIALLIWILTEILIIGYQSDPPLQLIYGILGILILITSFTPMEKRFYHS